MHASYNCDKYVQWNVFNYPVSQQYSEPKNLLHASKLQKSFLETITLKILLNNDVKRWELINFTNFTTEAHICVAILSSIIRNKRNY